MSNIKTQLSHLRDIIDTLQEANEHFTTLVQNKEMIHCINMLTTIVEGLEAVKSSLNTSDDNLNRLMERLEKTTLLIAQELELGRFLKIQELLQFAFTPDLKKFKESFHEVYGGSF